MYYVEKADMYIAQVSQCKSTIWYCLYYGSGYPFPYIMMTDIWNEEVWMISNCNLMRENTIVESSKKHNQK